jgi:hypothetical protein
VGIWVRFNDYNKRMEQKKNKKKARKRKQKSKNKQTKSPKKTKTITVNVFFVIGEKGAGSFLSSPEYFF